MFIREVAGTASAVVTLSLGRADNRLRLAAFDVIGGADYRLRATPL